MNLPPRLYRVAGICISMFAPVVALADVPPAMDRCPSDIPVVLSIKNVVAFQQGITTMATTLKIPAEAMSGLKKAEEVLKLPGLNADGSAAMAVLSLDDKAEHPPIVMVVPVKDYAAFAKALGGSGSGLEEVKFENEPAFVKDLGTGFAALGPTKEIVEKFEGKAGHSKEHETLMGATGKAIADSSDLLVLANMKFVGPMMKEGLDEFKGQMEGMAAMAGGNKAGFEMMASFADGFVRDASSGILGLRATDAGLRIESGAQFKEGSEFAGYLEGKGRSSPLMGALPQQDFLLALALDTSSPGFKKIAKNIVETSKKDPEAAKMMSGMNPLESIDKIDGMAFCMGQTPALMGGLFLNTTMFAKTSDPAGYAKQMKEGMGNMNGKTAQGVVYTTTYNSGGAKVGEKSVDVWSMKMAPDPNDATGMGQQVAQMQMVMFGPGGLGGYMAQTDNGVVVTYSKNSDLMAKALDAAKAGSGLGADTGVKAVAAQLPSERAFEVYFGVKSIMETLTGFLGMMGQGPTNFTPPADLPPIGLSGTAQSGGLRISTFVPTQVLVAIKTLSDSMGGGDEAPAEPAPKDKAGQPKF